MSTPAAPHPSSRATAVPMPPGPALRHFSLARTWAVMATASGTSGCVGGMVVTRSAIAFRGVAMLALARRPSSPLGTSAAAAAASARGSPLLLPPLAAPFASSSTASKPPANTRTPAAARSPATSTKAASSRAAAATAAATTKPKKAAAAAAASGPALLVVESPTKAQKIQRFLGADDYIVMASYGHVRDLSKKPGAVTTPPVVLEAEHEGQQQEAKSGGRGRKKKADGAANSSSSSSFDLAWELQPGADARLRDMARAARAAGGRVLLATDPDREGEAIAWHVAEELRRRGALAAAPSPSPSSSTTTGPPLRVTFTEVTKSAVERALASPRPLLSNLVDAYFARRALDYLVGYTLSPVLWRRLSGARSAGRVQSVALGMLCAREAEIEAFEPKPYWALRAAFQADVGDAGGGGGAASPSSLPSPSSSLLLFSARLRAVDGRRLGEMDVDSRARADELLARIRAAESDHGPWRVAAVTRSSARRTPPPPFVTSTLQQSASSLLGWSGTRTMRVAQQLYEGANAGEGLITYMRTDGTFVSEEGVKGLRAAARACYGPKYASEGPLQQQQQQQQQQQRRSAKNAQEAHEAIRPTRPLDVVPDGIRGRPGTLPPALTPEQRQLYALIWRRAVASQMPAAQLARVTADVESAERASPGALSASYSLAEDDDDGGGGSGNGNRRGEAKSSKGRRKGDAAAAMADEDGSGGGNSNPAPPALALRASGSVVTFDGFMAAWGSGSSSSRSRGDDEGDGDEAGEDGAGSAKRRRTGSGAAADSGDDDGDDDSGDARALQLLSAGQAVALARADAEAHVTRLPPRYSDGSLVRALEAAGVGRPSTYAPVLRLLEERGYAARGLPLPAQAQAAVAAAAAVAHGGGGGGGDNIRPSPPKASSSSSRALSPTPMGRLVSAFLAERFSQYVDPSFTSSVESRLDAIAAGEEPWRGVLGGFWAPFRRACAEATGVSVEQVFKDLDAALEPYLFPRTKRRREAVAGEKGAAAAAVAGEAEEEEEDPRRCPLCGGRLELKPARTSFAFIGCGNYASKGCTYARPIAGGAAVGGAGGSGGGGEQDGALLDALRRARDDAAEALSSACSSDEEEKDGEEGSRSMSPLRARRVAALEAAEAALALGGAGRVLGRHPETGELVVARLGPYGAYVQLGGVGASPTPPATSDGEEEEEEEEEQAEDGTTTKKRRRKTKRRRRRAKAPNTPKPKRASIPCAASGETPADALAAVTLGRAVALLSLPRDLGPHPDDGEPVVATRGPYGAYVKHRTLSAPLSLAAAPARRGRPRSSSSSSGGGGSSGGDDDSEGGEEGLYSPSSPTPPPPALEPETITLEQALELLAKRAERLRSRGVQNPYDAAEVSASSPRGRGRARQAAAAAASAAVLASSTGVEAGAASAATATKGRRKTKTATAAAADEDEGGGAKKKAAARSAPASRARVASAQAAAAAARSPSGYTLFVREQGPAVRAAASAAAGGTNAGAAGLAAVAAAWRELSEGDKEEWRRRAAAAG